LTGLARYSKTLTVPSDERSKSHSLWRPAAEVAALAIAYALATHLAVDLRRGGTLAPVWPASGVSLAGLLVFGRRAWPGVFIGGLLVRDPDAVTGWAAAGVHLGQTMAPLAAASVLKALRFDNGMNRVRDVLQLVFVGGGASVINAAIGTTVVLAAGVIPSGDVVEFGWTWWITDAMGVILVAPLLITWRTGTRPMVSWPGSRWAELLLVLVAAAVVSPVVFRSDLPLMFLTFPLLVWAALRIGQVGVSAVNVTVAVIAIWATTTGYGPFSHLSYETSLLVLEAFIASIATTSLLLGAAVTTARGLNDDNERLHAEIRAQLEEVRASRARIVQAAEAERRRIERNLHDGAQQRLTSLLCTLGLAQAYLGEAPRAELQGTLTQASRELTAALSELRELARGIHPPVLVQSGLRAAVESLAELSPVPVGVTAPARRFPPLVEATAYFIVCETLTNIAKHARATAAKVDIDEVDECLIVHVIDDGVGGADVNLGTGLTGLFDRVAALEGRLQIESSRGNGTRIRAELPCHGPGSSRPNGPLVTTA
jgi:signal transduction histidine kinase